MRISRGKTKMLVQLRSRALPWRSTASQEDENARGHEGGKRDGYRVFGTFGFVAIAAIIACLACRPTFAQSTQGITGIVTDSTGAVIPKAQVTVRSEGTGIAKQVVTTATGNYSVPFLDPGVYDVTAEATNFKTVHKTSITLVTGQTATVNFALPPGSVTQQVTVNASADVLNYQTADRGNVMEKQLIQELPENDGNTFNLAFLSPGMMSTTTGTAPGNQSAQSFGIHGGGVEFSIDGVTNQSETGPEHYTMAPPTQSLQEFKIVTSPIDAEYGRAPGGQIDMTLKTGTQKLHGSAYEYLQRAFLNSNTPQNDANIYFDKTARAPASSIAKFNKGAFSQNQYGFELDGPVIVPKLWNARKHTFFMLLYERIHNQGVGTALTSVPTPAMINGDFSGLLGLTVNNNPYNQAIYDPNSEAACTANNTDTGNFKDGHPAVCRYQYGYGPGAGPGPQGNPVPIGPANVIPAADINPVAKAILSWYPAPNYDPNPNTANPFNQNYVGLSPSESDNKSYIVKVDQNVGNHDTFDMTGKLWKFYAEANNAFPRYNVNAAHPGLNWAMNRPHYNGTDYRYPSLNVGWTHTFSATLVNSFRGLITTALESDSNGPASGFDPTTLGFSGNIAAANSTYFKRFPKTNLAGFNALGSRSVLYRGDDELQLLDTVNWVHGNHITHFGGEVRFTQYSQKSSNHWGLNLNTNQGWTQEWDTNVAGKTGIESSTELPNNYSGNSIASMEAGTWASANANAAGGNYFSSHYGALYFQDDWKVRPNLTLNLGVRWENPGRGLRDRENRLNSVWDFTDPNPVTDMIPASALAGLPLPNGFVGGPTYAGVHGNPTWEFKRVWYQFGPRAGFAYTFNQKTVVHGGMGLFFNDQNGGNSDQPSQIGYSTNTDYTGFDYVAQNSNTLMVPRNNLANPFPTFQSATGNCGGNWQQCLMANLGQGSSYYNPSYHPAEFLSSTFDIERQFTANDTLDIGYAGSRLYSDAYGFNMNPISATAQAACDSLRGGTITNCTGPAGQIANPFKGVAPFAGSGYYTASTIGKLEFSRPYPQFGDIWENLVNGGKTWYNGLEVVYKHRTSYGLTANLGYTYSKAIIANGYADQINHVPSRTISGVDVPHRFTALVVYKLPIARGSGFFPDMPRALDFLVGGWETANTYIYQSGFPQQLTSGWIVNKTANGGNLIPRKRYWNSTASPWYPGGDGKYNNNFIQRLKPCAATVSPTGGYVWIKQSEPFVKSGLCSTPNYIQINRTYQVNPNVEYTGARLGPRNQLDSNISKNFPIREGMSFQMRIDAFNSLNHLQTFASGYDTSTSDGTFGMLQLGNQSNGNQTSRVIQISGRLNW